MAGQLVDPPPWVPSPIETGIYSTPKSWGAQGRYHRPNQTSKRWRCWLLHLPQQHLRDLSTTSCRNRQRDYQQDCYGNGCYVFHSLPLSFCWLQPRLRYPHITNAVKKVMHFISYVPLSSYSPTLARLPDGFRDLFKHYSSRYSFLATGWRLSHMRNHQYRTWLCWWIRWIIQT